MGERDRPLVFVSGPYSAPSEPEEQANIQRAVDVGRAVFQKGYYPIVPHLLVREYYIRGDGGLFGYESLMQYTLAILVRCDAVLLYGHSPGADRECRAAEALGKPVYFGVDQLPDLNDQEGPGADSGMQGRAGGSS